MTQRSFSAKVTKTTSIKLLVVLMGVLLAGSAKAQTKTNSLDETQKPAAQAALNDDADAYFKTIYRDFYNTYKLGPADQIAVRVLGQPDYTLEKVQVSPVGRIYHPLVGDVDVAGLTISRVTEKLTIATRRVHSRAEGERVAD